MRRPHLLVYVYPTIFPRNKLSNVVHWAVVRCCLSLQHLERLLLWLLRQDKGR